MSGRKARAVRQASRPPVPAVRSTPSQRSFWLSWKGGFAAIAIAAVIVASIVLPGVVSSNDSTSPHAGMELGVEHGAGLPVGSLVPKFSEKDVETGRAITSRSLDKGKTLLFFSEGVMCQACFQQIKGLEDVGAELRKRGVRLLSVTPDSSGELRQAVAQYGITTPMIADTDRDMSAAFNTLGKGMHGDTPGHAFVLVNRGKVLWYRDYWLPPTRSMYVKPRQLLADMPV
jgi:peroxiredoxin Q/BCP